MPPSSRGRSSIKKASATSADIDDKAEETAKRLPNYLGINTIVNTTEALIVSKTPDSDS